MARPGAGCDRPARRPAAGPDHRQGWASAGSGVGVLLQGSHGRTGDNDRRPQSSNSHARTNPDRDRSLRAIVQKSPRSSLRCLPRSNGPSMGIRTRGYELPSGRYLPDFKIHDCKKIAGFYWLECKGETPSDREVKLTREHAAATRSPVVFFNSSVFEQIRRSHKIYKEFYHSKGWGAHEITDPFECWDISNDVKWLQLWDRYSVVGKEMTDLGLCEVESLWPQWPLGKTFRAANAALKARFEHGEGFS